MADCCCSNTLDERYTQLTAKRRLSSFIVDQHINYWPNILFIATMIAAAVTNILNANKLNRPLTMSRISTKHVYLLTVSPSGRMRVSSVICDYKYCQLSWLTRSFSYNQPLAVCNSAIDTANTRSKLIPIQTVYDWWTAGLYVIYMCVLGLTFFSTVPMNWGLSGSEFSNELTSHS